MRIAVTGSHGVGKSTLVEDFAASFPHFAHVQEPYLELVQAGVAFADGATSADLEEQLAMSCRLVSGESRQDVIFDRCPIDFVAYLEVVSRQEGFEWEPSGRQLAALQNAVGTLDLLVFLPVTSPDEIKVSIEEPALRARVDRRLKALLQDDELELFEGATRLVEVAGVRRARLRRLADAANLAVHG